MTAVNADGEESAPAQAGPVAAEWMASAHVVSATTSRNCGKCHAVHEGEGDLVYQSETATTSPGQTATCLVCHDGKRATAANVASGSVDSFALRSGHSIETSEAGDRTTACSSCHAVHVATSDSPMLPLQAAGVNGPVWCYQCHDAADSWYDGDYPAASSPSRDASGYP